MIDIMDRKEYFTKCKFGKYLMILKRKTLNVPRLCTSICDLNVTNAFIVIDLSPWALS